LRQSDTTQREKHVQKGVREATDAADAAPLKAERRAARAGEARIRSLERENARLRRVVASQALTIEALREISRGTY
jgi:hypothetical protein